MGKADTQPEDVEEILASYRAELKTLNPEEGNSWPMEFLESVDNLRHLRLESYPGPKTAYVLRARRAVSKQSRGAQILLDDHSAHVEGVAGTMAFCLEADLKEAVVCGARLHDYGKVDVRYQAWLRNGDQMAARYSGKPIAKSGNDVLLKQVTVGLPSGFRHELLSLLFAEKSSEVAGEIRDLILHLVASHHGSCRPFAPVTVDEGAECVSYNGITICKEERWANAPHKLDRGVPDRFWRLTAAFGWWGLAYIESMLRLADWWASREEASEVSS